ncbi:hypothetical protein PTI45_03998 [Paenibacillus nuruki]|uniref:Uncharacterized protein n=1 Tax=Paenibacillus nuruki TaxID=1886670 RepID=A0A1E3KZ72_9BACL|nr:hypothetical protein PTI45_03998 [Paenibacillus nuruki]
MMPESMMMLDRMLYFTHTCRRGSILLCTLVYRGQSAYMNHCIKKPVSYDIASGFLCI